MADALWLSDSPCSDWAIDATDFALGARSSKCDTGRSLTHVTIRHTRPLADKKKTLSLTWKLQRRTNCAKPRIELCPVWRNSGNGNRTSTKRSYASGIEAAGLASPESLGIVLPRANKRCMKEAFFTRPTLEPVSVDPSSKRLCCLKVGHSREGGNAK